jgi:peptide/nickel transport system substrate-binding protein
MRRRLALGGLVGLALAGLAVSGARAQTKDDTLVYALVSDVGNWDPPNSVLRESIILGYHVFDHLAARDPKTGKVGPGLALSWKALDDTTWEVKLRPGVRFHDGSPFTGRDVKATFERVLDPARKMPLRGNHLKVKTVEVVDDLTVKFHTDGPYPIFVERMTSLTMQSDKVIREKGHDWMQENPVGTGPYKLVRWDRKREHLLVRNDDYWGAKPHFKYVRVRIIPEQATQIAELIAGGVDIIKAVPPDQMDTIARSGSARVSTSPILRTALLQLDQSARGGPNPFTDRRVRQAANLAVDMDAIIKHVLNGLGDRVATVINPMAFGFDPSLKPYRPDHERARKLLAEAGYPAGFEARFQTGLEGTEPGTLQTNEAIVADLAKVGIRAQQQYIGDTVVYSTRVREGKAGPMFNLNWGYYSVFDADAMLFDIFKCGEPFTYYCNKELDDLIMAGRSTLDARKRADVYQKAQKLLYDDAGAIFKWALRGVWGVSNRVEYEAPRDEIDRMFVVTPRKR